MLVRPIRSLLRWGLCLSLFVGGLLGFSSGASAGISIHGGTPESRGRLVQLLDEQGITPSFGERNLAITIGRSALVAFCKQDSETPVLATYLYESRFNEVSANCQQIVEPIFVDASLEAANRLARAIFPDTNTAMLSASPIEDSEPSDAVSPIQLPVPSEGVAKGLARLIDEGGWDVFLLPVDSRIFEVTDYRLSLETLFRHRKPSIVTIRSLLNQGAAAAVYYTPEQLEEAVIRSVREYGQSGHLAGTRPGEIRVDINRTVLRHLYGRVITAEELRAIQAEVNGG